MNAHSKTPVHPIPARTKWAFTTRRVVSADVAAVAPLRANMRAGDVLLCEVVTIGQHTKLQRSDQRFSLMYPGDLVAVCLGDRYAPDQFFGCAKLNGETADLLAGGGLVGTADAAHGSMARPTQLRPLGVMVDRLDKVINIKRYAITPAKIPDTMTVFGVFGASMNAGKTTAAACLAHGLMRAGHKVAGIKATGTGAFGDFNAFEDAGVPASDFTDAGFASTFRIPLSEIETGFEALVGHAARRGATVAVVEIADGVFQKETGEILAGSKIIERMDGLLFAAPDALGAVGGVQLLDKHGLKPFAISGKVSCSPLGTEEAQLATGIPVLTRQELCDGPTVRELTDPLLRDCGTFRLRALAA